jgi:uncharacterized protein (TIGR03000 family)
MNRIVLFGLSTFFSLVGIGLIGSPKPARAGHGIFLQGCHAWNPCWGCHGCSGCCSCYGAKNCSHSCYGCYSSGGCHGCYGCQGCYGSGGCYASCYGYGYAVPVEVPIEVPVQSAPVIGPAPMPTESSGTNLGQQDRSADLMVHLPAEARLYVNDQAMQNVGSARHLRSPQLAADKMYQYELRAEITREGQTTTETKLVKVMAGKSQAVTFDLASNAMALVSQR